VSRTKPPSQTHISTARDSTTFSSTGLRWSRTDCWPTSGQANSSEVRDPRRGHHLLRLV